MICRICGARSDAFGRARIRRTHDVDYYRCSACGFIQTEEPYWLAEAYGEPINRSDTGLLARSIGLAWVAASVIWGLFDPAARFVDYGGGYGVFVRLMRDKGFDFYWQDPHAENLFAKGFEYQPGQGAVNLVTAFECVEHMADPAGGAAEMRRIAPNVLLTTELVPSESPRPGEWWYYGLDHGQHISFFTNRALAHLAERVGCRVYTCGAVHLLTDRPVSDRRFRRLVRLAPLLGRWASRGLSSKTESDSIRIRGEA